MYFLLTFFFCMIWSSMSNIVVRYVLKVGPFHGSRLYIF